MEGVGDTFDVIECPKIKPIHTGSIIRCMWSGKWPKRRKKFKSHSRLGESVINKAM